MDTCWTTASKDFNRFIQKIRRLHNSKVQFIRAVEAHQDSYPHIHCILQFSTPLTVNHGRYFDTALYAKWKQLWTFGLSDFQQPKSKQAPILYLIKYISKSGSSYRTLWRKMFLSEYASDQQQSIVKTSTTSSEDETKFSTTIKLCKFYKIKQLSWSRKFAYPLFSRDSKGQTYLLKHAHIALSNAPNVTQTPLLPLQ